MLQKRTEQSSLQKITSEQFGPVTKNKNPTRSLTFFAPREKKDPNTALTMLASPSSDPSSPPSSPPPTTTCQQPSRDEMKTALHCQHRHQMSSSLSTPPLSKRQAAYEAALFYGECGLKKISCAAAQEEAFKACDLYETYWVKNMHRGKLVSSRQQPKNNSNETKNATKENAEEGVDRKTGWREFLKSFSNSVFFGDGQSSNTDELASIARTSLGEDSTSLTQPIVVTDSSINTSESKEKSYNHDGGLHEQQAVKYHEPSGNASKRKSSAMITNPSSSSCCDDDNYSNKNHLRPHRSKGQPYIVRDFDSCNAARRPPSAPSNVANPSSPSSSSLPAKNPLEATTSNFPRPEPPLLLPPTRHEMETAKNALVTILRSSNGDVTTPEFLQSLHMLSNLYQRQIKCYKYVRHHIISPSGDFDYQKSQKRSFLLHQKDYSQLDGRWLTLSKPDYHSNEGTNVRCDYLHSNEDAREHKGKVNAGTGDTLYTLGRMSFGMFYPSDLLCTIQGIYNTVHVCHSNDSDEDEEDDYDDKHHKHTVTNDYDNEEERRQRRRRKRRRQQKQRRDSHKKKWMDHAEKCDLPEYIPSCLKEEVRRKNLKKKGEIRSYNIVVAFTIEPNQEKGHSSSSASSSKSSSCKTKVNRPIRGIMTTYGYAIPDPNVPRRLSIWFTGGTLEVNDEDADGGEWRRIFGRRDDQQQPGSNGTTTTKDRNKEGSKADDTSVTTPAAPTASTTLSRSEATLKEKARLLAARVFLGARLSDGMDEDGTMSYHLSRPVGGHGRAFCDVLFLDETLRVMKGHHGSIYVFARVPSFPSAC